MYVTAISVFGVNLGRVNEYEYKVPSWLEAVENEDHADYSKPYPIFNDAGFEIITFGTDEDPMLSIGVELNKCHYEYISEAKMPSAALVQEWSESLTTILKKVGAPGDLSAPQLLLLLELG